MTLSCSRVSSALAVTLPVLIGLAAAQATPLLGSSFGATGEATLYDVDLATGQAVNGRPMGLRYLVGIAYSPSGVLYGLTNAAAPANPNSLFTIDPATAASQLVGATGLGSITEGDLACDPTTGTLYGLYNLDGDKRQLFTLDTTTAAATIIPGSLAGDPSAMAFDGAGTLHVIDTSLQELLTVDKITGVVLTFTPLSEALGSVAGMAVDPATGTFYVADGESDGTDRLYTLEPATGVLTEIGPTGLPDGLAGLAFVPEPATILLLALGGLGVTRRRQR